MTSQNRRHEYFIKESSPVRPIHLRRCQKLPSVQAEGVYKVEYPISQGIMGLTTALTFSIHWPAALVTATVQHPKQMDHSKSWHKAAVNKKRAFGGTAGATTKQFLTCFTLVRLGCVKRSHRTCHSTPLLSTSPLLAGLLSDAPTKRKKKKKARI